MGRPLQGGGACGGARLSIKPGRASACALGGLGGYPGEAQDYGGGARLNTSASASALALRQVYIKESGQEGAFT